MRMSKIVIVGLGPGDLGLVTLDAWHRLTGDNPVFLRTSKHPMVNQLTAKGIKWQSFDEIYEREGSFAEVYAEITKILISQAVDKEIVYGVPGHPMVAETTVTMLLEERDKNGIAVELVPGMSFLDACYHLLRIDPSEGLVIHDGLDLSVEQLVLNKGQLICQVYNKAVASEVKLTLMDKLTDDYKITVIIGAGVPEMEQLIQIPLYELDRLDGVNHLTSIYVPPLAANTEKELGFEKKEGVNNSLEPIMSVMEKLRSETGCPWDREQNHNSLQKYLIEETYEVIEALEEKNMYKLCDELGDLLLQIVFHAQIARENDYFDINQVVEAITTKMIRRHPHVFGEKNADSSAEVLKTWEQIKKEERQEQGIIRKSILAVPPGFPALMKAQKLQQQAARVGFDWPDISGVKAKIEEEWNELEEAVNNLGEAEIKDEFGDMLFALVNLARFLNIDAEEVLRQNCNKFINRFNFMEKEAIKKKVKLTDLNLHQLEILWEKSKKNSINEEKPRN